MASAASRVLPSPMRRLTIAIVPMASDRQTGNMRNRNWNAAPTAAVDTAPRCPTNAKMVACPAAAIRFSMIPGHASSSAACCGWRAASAAARGLGAGVASSAASTVELKERR